MILDHRDRCVRTKGHKHEFLVRWLGYGPEHDTWEPKENLQNCQESLGRYCKSLQQTQSAHEKVSWGTKRQENSLARHSQTAWVNQLCPACACLMCASGTCQFSSGMHSEKHQVMFHYSGINSMDSRVRLDE